MNQPLKQLFVAEAVLSQVKEARSVRRKRRTWGKSVLTKYLTELIRLREAGASFADLQFWLRTEKRVKVVRTTIMRALDKAKPATIQKN